MSHPHLPAAEERTAEAQRSNNPQNDAFVGGSPWSRIIRVKDYSETLTLPGSDLLVTPRTGHFDWVGSWGRSERAVGLVVALFLLLTWPTDANLGRGLPCRYEMKSYRK